MDERCGWEADDVRLIESSAWRTRGSSRAGSGLTALPLSETRARAASPTRDARSRLMRYPVLFLCFSCLSSPIARRVARRSQPQGSSAERDESPA